jgi:hypothetical protein
MQRYNIDTCAMLVEFNASVWTARKLDRNVTDEVVRDKGAAEKGAARVNKNLLAGRKELEVIQQFVSEVRNYVYACTLPWSDSGLRLLPVVKFQRFNADMAQHEDKYWKLCESFVTAYPFLITAQAMALGDMFKRDEYPSPDSIKSKFGFHVNYMPVPTSGDFRVDVGDAAQAELQKQLSELADKRVEAAMADVRARIGDHLRRMSDRLHIDVVDGQPKPRRFHDTLVESGLELCDTVKALNVTQDPDLEKARAALERSLTSVTVITKKNGKELSVADTLREDMQQRSALKTQVDEMLNKFNW